jgi:hypothetical protein
MKDPASIFDGAPRFRTARITVRHWADRGAYREVLRRYAANAHVAAMLERAEDLPSRWSSEEESVWRIWLERPFLFRVEEEWRAGTLTDISGGDARGGWQFIPSENRVYRKSGGLTTSVSRLGEGEATLAELAELDATSPLFRIPLHPIVAELLDPGELFLIHVPGRPEVTPRLDVLGPTTFLGREATRLRAVITDWARRAPMDSENLWVADDYELIADDATAVILRLACRANGQEFSVREMTEVAFDEPIDPSMFEPPAGVRERPSSLPLARIQRRLRRRRPRF